MEKIEIRDLPPSRFHYPVHALYQTEPFEDSNSPPRGRLTTAWLFTKKVYFRIYLSVMGPILKKSKGEISLSQRKPQDILQEITDIIKAFNKETLGKETVI